MRRSFVAVRVISHSYRRRRNHALEIYHGIEGTVRVRACERGRDHTRDQGGQYAMRVICAPALRVVRAGVPRCWSNRRLTIRKAAGTAATSSGDAQSVDSLLRGARMARIRPANLM